MKFYRSLTLTLRLLPSFGVKSEATVPKMVGCNRKHIVSNRSELIYVKTFLRTLSFIDIRTHWLIMLIIYKFDQSVEILSCQFRRSSLIWHKCEYDCLNIFTLLKCINSDRISTLIHFIYIFINMLYDIF